MRQPLALFLALLLLATPLAIAEDDSTMADVEDSELEGMEEETEKEQDGASDEANEVSPNKRHVKNRVQNVRANADSEEDRDRVKTRVRAEKADMEGEEMRVRKAANAADRAKRQANVRSRVRENVEDVEAFADLTDEQKTKLRKLSPARRAALAESDDVEGELDEIEVTPSNEIDFSKRKVAKKRMQELRQAGRQAREQFSEDRNAFKERREGLREKRDQLKECDEENEDCDALREEVFSEAQQTLLSAISAYINRMDALASKIEESDTLSDEQVERILNWIDRRIDLAERMQSAAEEAENKDELKKVAKAFERLVKSTKNKISSTATGSYGRTVFKVLKRAEHFDARLQCSVDEGADLDLEEFESALAAARIALEEAKDLHNEGDNQGARESISAAKEELRDAVQLGKALFKELKEQGLRLSDCDVAIDEDEEFIDIEVEENEDEVAEIEGLLEEEE